MLKAHREKAERVVDRYLTVIMSTDKDAGWQGCGLIGKLIDFLGQIPDSSGFSGFSTVWEKSVLVRDWSHKHIAAVRLVNKLTPEHREAVAIDRAYRGRTKAVAIDPLRPGQPAEIKWDDARIALALGITVTAFRVRVHRGYLQLTELMGLQECVERATETESKGA